MFLLRIVAAAATTVCILPAASLADTAVPASRFTDSVGAP